MLKKKLMRMLRRKIPQSAKNVMLIQDKSKENMKKFW